METQIVTLTSMSHHFWRYGGCSGKRGRGAARGFLALWQKDGEQHAGVSQKVEAAACEELI